MRVSSAPSNVCGHLESCRTTSIDEPLYRQGFEAALQPATAGKSYAEALEFLQTRYPDGYREEAFRRGYARGQTYYKGLRGTYQG